MKILWKIIFSMAFSSAFAVGQNLVPGSYTVHGSIMDTTGAAIAGLLVTVDETTPVDPAPVTDLNGEFNVVLPVGDHVLTIKPLDLYHFKVFIKIGETGPNPDNVRFTLDMSRVCCKSPTGEPFAKPISLPRPHYPAAAQATMSKGEVIVSVKIDREGKVTRAQALNGATLLRATAVATAKNGVFEPAQSDDREARVTYVFIDDEVLREGVRRYSNPYRIDVTASRVIDTSSYPK